MNWDTTLRGDLMYAELAKRLKVGWEVTHPQLLAALNECHAWYLKWGIWNSTSYALTIYAVIFRKYFPVLEEVE